MKEAFWGYFIIITGVVGIAILMLFQDVTNTNDQNYYLTKEITDAALIDAFDIPYYRVTGKIAIDKEAFVESFLRRYAESASATRNYNITINDVVEYPPKVSVTVTSQSQAFSVTGDQFAITNKLDQILETNYVEGTVD